MEEKLESLQTELNEFDIAMWKMWQDGGESTMEKLKQLESDTISLEMALEVESYSTLNAKLPGLLKGQENCVNQVGAIRWRLNKLKKDIDKGSGRRDRYNEFLSSEEYELEILEEKFALYKSTHEEIKTDFSLTQEKVNAIISERMLTEEVQ